jgi:hypothetical protein
MSCAPSIPTDTGTISLPAEQQVLLGRAGAACQRALRWRRLCAERDGYDSAHIATISFVLLATETLVHQPRRLGWMTIGHVLDPMVDDRLRILWHESTDRVQLDRPPQRSGHSRQDQPARARELYYGVVIQLTGESVELHARLSIGRSAGAVTLQVPLPLPESRRRRVWFLAMMRLAAERVHYVRVPPAFPFWTGLDRRRFMLDFAHDLAIRMAEPPRRVSRPRGIAA